MTALVDLERAVDALLDRIGCGCGSPELTLTWDTWGRMRVTIDHVDPSCPGGSIVAGLVEVETGGRL